MSRQETVQKIWVVAKQFSVKQFNLPMFTILSVANGRHIDSQNAEILWRWFNRNRWQDSLFFTLPDLSQPHWLLLLKHIQLITHLQIFANRPIRWMYQAVHPKPSWLKYPTHNNRSDLNSPLIIIDPCNHHKEAVLFLKNGPIPASFCLFSFFSCYNFNTNWKKSRWCAWDTNPGPQDDRRRWNHGAVAAIPSSYLFIWTNHGANAVEKFSNRVVMLCWNKAVWLDVVLVTWLFLTNHGFKAISKF